MVEILFEKIKNNAPKISTFQYDADLFTLTVEFSNNETIQYLGVPDYIYSKLVKSASRDQFFNKYIKHAGFSYEYV